MIHNQSHDGRTVVSVISQYEISTRLVLPSTQKAIIRSFTCASHIHDIAENLPFSAQQLTTLTRPLKRFTRSEITSIFYVWYVVYFCHFALPFQSTSSLLHMEQIPTVQNMFSLPHGEESNRKCTFYSLHVAFV